MGKERRLTKRETARMEELRKKEEQLREQGVTRKDLTIGIVAANILAIVIMLPFMLISILAFFMVNGRREFRFFYEEPLYTFLLLIVFFICIVLHELIHGLVWGFFASGHFKDIEFGIIWSALTPYSTCKTELKRYQYVIGAVMPTIILGFLTAVIAVLTGSGGVLFISVFMILGGGGDFLIVGKLLAYRGKGKEYVIIDHPSELGLIIFERPLFRESVNGR